MKTDASRKLKLGCMLEYHQRHWHMSVLFVYFTVAVLLGKFCFLRLISCFFLGWSKYISSDFVELSTSTAICFLKTSLNWVHLPLSTTWLTQLSLKHPSEFYGNKRKLNSRLYPYISTLLLYKSRIIMSIGKACDISFQSLD